MTTRKESLAQRVAAEAKKAFKLTLYFGIWFSALVFLTHEIMRQDGLPFGHWGLAWIKAALCAKFILIGQAIFPMTAVLSKSIWRVVLPRSFVYLAIVIGLSILEAGLEGLLHGHPFVTSLKHFANGDPIYALAVSWVYWLILVPYLLFDELLGTRKAQAV